MIRPLSRKTGVIWYCADCPASGVIVSDEGNPSVYAWSEALREVHGEHWLAIRILRPDQWKQDLGGKLYIARAGSPLFQRANAGNLQTVTDSPEEPQPKRNV
jgi:hypothetical protein